LKTKLLINAKLILIKIKNINFKMKQEYFFTFFHKTVRGLSPSAKQSIWANFAPTEVVTNGEIFLFSNEKEVSFSPK